MDKDPPDGSLFFSFNTLETLQKYFRVDRKEISFLKFILEGYDGIALLRTVDSEDGIVVLHIAPGCESEVEMLLRALKKEMLIEDAAEAGV